MAPRHGSEAIPGAGGKQLQSATTASGEASPGGGCGSLAQAPGVRTNEERDGGRWVSMGLLLGWPCPHVSWTLNRKYRRFSFVFKLKTTTRPGYGYRRRIMRIAVSATCGTPIHKFLPYRCFVAYHPRNPHFPMRCSSIAFRCWCRFLI